MSRSQAMRDRARRVGISPSQRVVKPVDDDAIHEIDRREVPFPSLAGDEDSAQCSTSHSRRTYLPADAARSPMALEL
jgi:hypothetical protein